MKINWVKWIYSFLIFFYYNTLHAQFNQKISTFFQETKPVDVNDLVLRIFHSKSDSSIVKERNDSIPWRIFPAILPGFGYTQLTGPTFVITSNFSTYISNPKTTNLSSIFIAPEISLKHQKMVNFNANLWTKENKWNILSDDRYYNYWVNDYGLGKYTNKNDFYLVEYSYSKIHFQLNRQLEPNLFIGLGFNSDIHSAVRVSQKHGSVLAQSITSSPLMKYTNSTGLELCFLFDQRKNTNQPVAPGSYFHTTVRQNSMLMGSTQNWTYVGIDWRKYYQFLKNQLNHVVIGFWCFGKFSLGKQIPYFDRPSTMWDDLDNSGRPFIQGRFRGKQMIYLESELRFPITKNELVNGAFFINTQTFSSKKISELSQLIPACGGSLRFLINKDSKVNFIISYGIGYKGERGLFFTVGEVF